VLFYHYHKTFFSQSSALKQELREKDDSLSELSMKLNETNAQLTLTKESLVKEQEKVKIHEMRLKEMNDQLHQSDRQFPDKTRRVS